MKKTAFFLIVACTFLIGFFTLRGYGINWDTINHLPRGQAYLHYFLTGKKDYSDLAIFKKYFQDPNKIAPSTTQSRSYYQSNAADFNWFVQEDGNGHPPLSDIFSSIFNRVLYGKFHLVNDIDAYHVYGIFLAAVLVGVVYLWMNGIYGKIVGILSAAFLFLYPLFFSEMHFNTEKDVPETVYWSIFMFCIWKGFTKKNIKWILASGIFFGLALGTKFNILFASVVIIPWLIYYIAIKHKEFHLTLTLKLLSASLVAFTVGIIIFVGSWPYLWNDPIARVMGVFGYYKGIGLTLNSDPRFLGLFGINLYPIKWIIYTTPPILLAFFAVGVLYSVYLVVKKKDSNVFLFLLWFAIPVARVSYPGTTIYGGIRQIMEYVPAMAIIAAIGANFLISKIKNKFLIFLFVLSAIIAVAIPVWKTHPNENTYFNFLIGGLSGAKAANIPSWGDSFGSAYRQGVEWLNENAPLNSNIVLPNELTPNIPGIWFRKDLSLDNHLRSGPSKIGEYALALTYQGTSERSYYDSYLETILDPVFEVKVDGVGILKIWKNDINHTKHEFVNEDQIKDFDQTISDGGISIDLGNQYLLSKIQGKFYSNSKCTSLLSMYSETSTDGKNWVRQPGVMPKEDWNTSAFGEQPTKDTFIEPFAATKARYVKFTILPISACVKNLTSLNIYVFKSN